jgi:hypothetical protein
MTDESASDAAGTPAEPTTEPAGVAPASHPPTPPQITPITVNSARIVFIGTGLWALGFVLLLPFYTELGRHHHRVWLWTCLAGVGVGIFAYVLTHRHRATGRTD